jgi:hypothetical protein
MEESPMTLEMRNAVREARKKLRMVIESQSHITEDDAAMVYNLAIKSYIKGMYEAIQITKRELEKEYGSLVPIDSSGGGALLDD